MLITAVTANFHIYMISTQRKQSLKTARLWTIVGHVTYINYGGPDWWRSQAAVGPRAVIWRPLVYINTIPDTINFQKNIQHQSIICNNLIDYIRDLAD